MEIVLACIFVLILLYLLKSKHNIPLDTFILNSACKYEEIYPPEVRDCVYICDRAYDRQQVLDMEQRITNTLNFQFSGPTGHMFLERFIFIAKASKLQGLAATYYMERMLQEYHLLKYKPSLVAAAAVTLAVNHQQIRNHEKIRGAKPGVVSSLHFGVEPHFLYLFPLSQTLTSSFFIAERTFGLHQIFRIINHGSSQRYCSSSLRESNDLHPTRTLFCEQEISIIKIRKNC